MKKVGMRFVGKFRRALATTFACSVVVGIPLLSINQYGHFFKLNSRLHPDTRQATPLSPFQVRAVDQNSKPYTLFKEPLISITFDDGWETTYTTVLPLLQKYGIHSTQYVLSGYADYPGYLTWDQIKSMSDGGHEIACHTDSHPDLRTISDEQVMSQLTMCKDKVLDKVKVKPVDFASPYGSYDDRTIGMIKPIFQSQRNTNGDPTNGVNDADVNIEASFDRYQIIAVTINNATTLKQIQQLVDFTVKNNGWLVLTYHQADDSSSKWSADPNAIEDQFSLLSSSKARIVTVAQALNSQHIKAQD